MAQQGLVVETKDPQDGRRNVITLSERGHALATTIQPQYTDVSQVVEDMLTQSSHNLWKALEE